MPHTAHAMERHPNPEQLIANVREAKENLIRARQDLERWLSQACAASTASDPGSLRGHAAPTGPSARDACVGRGTDQPTRRIP
jgi:hypothetical protein